MFKKNLCLAAFFCVLSFGFNFLAVSGEIERKKEIETVAAEVKTECYEMAGLCQQYLGICMETLCGYRKYQKEIGASDNEIRELNKEIADLPNRIERFLNKPDLLDQEINSLDFNNADECQHALKVLNEMSIALEESILQLKAQITVKKGVLREIKEKTIVLEIKERFVIIKKETDNLVAVQNDLAGIYDEFLVLIIRHQKELGTSIEEIKYYQDMIKDTRAFSEELIRGRGVLENEIKNLLNPDNYKECAVFLDYIENYLMFILSQKASVMEEIAKAAANLESLQRQLGGYPNE